MGWALEQIARTEKDLVVLEASVENGEDSLVSSARALLGVEGEEGAQVLAEHLRAERSSGVVRRKKQRALELHGCLKCEVCDLDAAERYGEFGKGVCEVHHRTPFSTQRGRRVTTLDDLAIVCATCHRVLHRRHPVLQVEALRANVLALRNEVRA